MVCTVAVAVAVMEIFLRAVMEKDWSCCTVRCVVLVSLIQRSLDIHLITPLLEGFIPIIDSYVMSGCFNQLDPAAESINHLNHFILAVWCLIVMQYDMCFHVTWVYCSACCQRACDTWYFSKETCSFLL